MVVEAHAALLPRVQPNVCLQQLRCERAQQLRCEHAQTRNPIYWVLLWIILGVPVIRHI